MGEKHGNWGALNADNAEIAYVTRLALGSIDDARALRSQYFELARAGGATDGGLYALVLAWSTFDDPGAAAPNPVGHALYGQVRAYACLLLSEHITGESGANSSPHQGSAVAVALRRAGGTHLAEAAGHAVAFVNRSAELFADFRVDLFFTKSDAVASGVVAAAENARAQRRQDTAPPIGLGPEKTAAVRADGLVLDVRSLQTRALRGDEEAIAALARIADAHAGASKSRFKHREAWTALLLVLDKVTNGGTTVLDSAGAAAALRELAGDHPDWGPRLNPQLFLAAAAAWCAGGRTPKWEPLCALFVDAKLHGAGDPSTEVDVETVKNHWANHAKKRSQGRRG